MLNVLFITADDMNYDAPGFTGNRIPGLTPNLDRLAAEGHWFVNAHVAVAICQPSRQAMMTGRYPHNNGSRGFDPISTAVPTLQEQLRAAGYFNGILGKALHCQPVEKFCWDYLIDGPALGIGRNPALYRQHVAAFLAQAKQAGRPFFLMANSHDPHRPFAGSEQEKQHEKRLGVQFPPASRYVRDEEVTVPGFLPDIPEVRKEVAQYYSSVHRCDETVGAILGALEESGLAEQTLVMFLSDNGMAFPFAKTNCYLASTRTPWLVRFPGVVKAGSVDRENFISGVDFMPTILDACGLESPGTTDGRSFLPLLRGEKQANREHAYTLINTIAGGKAYPMRGLQGRDFAYIFNDWSDGQTIFKNESKSGLTYNAMVAAASDDPFIASRVRTFDYRTPEELYDLRTDPHVLKNLIEKSEYREAAQRMRQALAERMAASKDPMLEAFRAKVRVLDGEFYARATRS